MSEEEREEGRRVVLEYAGIPFKVRQGPSPLACLMARWSVGALQVRKMDYESKENMWTVED